MKIIKIIHTFLLSLIGVVSLLMTISIVFDLFGVREKEGNYVLFIVYANMICSLLYILSAFLNWKNPKLGRNILLFASLILIVAFVEFFIYIKKGGIYEQKTIYAMTFRTIFTILMVYISIKFYKKN